MNKRTVHFDPARGSTAPVPGRSAIVWPIDHYASDRVSNAKHVLTSAVVKVNADGSFETENSIYVPQESKA